MAKLMIVDDEVDVREYLKNFFTRRKIEVITAESGEEALELFKSNEPDLMLLDFRMSGIDGIETLRRIRETGSKVKVIMVTGIENGDLLTSLLDLEVSAFIHKPLVLEELEREVLQRLMTK